MEIEYIISASFLHERKKELFEYISKRLLVIVNSVPLGVYYSVKGKSIKKALEVYPRSEVSIGTANYTVWRVKIGEEEFPTDELIMPFDDHYNQSLMFVNKNLWDWWKNYLDDLENKVRIIVGTSIDCERKIMIEIESSFGYRELQADKFVNKIGG